MKGLGDRSENISNHELVCKCGCGKNDTPQEVIDVVQDVCDHFSEMLNRKVILDINSGNRCETYNKSIGGAPASRHIVGDAIDFVIRGVSPHKVWSVLSSKYPDKYGIGKYVNFTHIDVRPTKARW